MQLEFDKTVCRYLHRLTGELQSQEQTQELRLTEGMPDIGNVIGAWGQVLIRGKEWRSGSMSLSGGVMVWALYAPEDGSAVQKVEGWLPFQMKWELPDTPHDGVIQAAPYLRSVDARSISARKLILRAVIEVFAEGYVQAEAEISVPGSVPEDLQLLRKQHSLLLPKEAGEKAFEISETLSLPASAPQIRSLIRFGIQPEITDQKVMSDKGVFRGSSAIHILYDDDEGMLHNWDFEVPFSQFTQLDADYAPDAQVQLIPVVTALEMEVEDSGNLNLNAGMTCQYLVYDKEEVELVEDVYSLNRQAAASVKQLELPVVAEWEQRTLQAEQKLDVAAQRVVDTVFLPAAPRQRRKTGALDMELSGQLQPLYYDDQQKLCFAAATWKDAQEIPMEDTGMLQSFVANTGIPQATPLGGQLQMSAELLMQKRTVCTREYPMVMAVELGEEIVPDPQRPSLILRRAGQDDLWQMAKEHGTTVEQIRQANRLTEEPVPGQMLLIPIP